MAMTDEQHLQRSKFQFEIIKLNMLVNGGLIAFAIENKNTWQHLLIACPVASLILFSLWFHHALVIMIEQGGSANSSDDKKPTGVQYMRMWSFALSMLANFVLLPLAAVFIFSLETASFLNYFAFPTIFITACLFLLWFRLQYISSSSINKFLD